jgi:KUP system potassium uptake protein
VAQQESVPESPAETKAVGELPPRSEDGEEVEGRRLVATALAALGVVYGDIGTSPLYAIRECFHGDFAIPVSRANVFGVLSLVFWSLIIVISLKYLLLVMRADNRGEGGILALMALVRSKSKRSGTQARALVVMGLFGAALLYGDGMITPAISVLSAVEGLHVATPLFAPYVIPITVVILTGLFVLQKRGTARVGAVFGPITLLWFLVIGTLGVVEIVQAPSILAALMPWHALTFFHDNGVRGLLVLGAVVLVVTGGEALYADMGHFGKRPIRLAWFCLVLPALVLSYFGQGALLLRHPDAAANPFYYIAPNWGLYPLVLLATAATVIASQAVISGAFSLTRQALHLGFCPRITVEHTSREEIGQVYVGTVNWLLYAATVGLVLGFRSSSHLAAAYGVAVITTMVITTALIFVVASDIWGWGPLRAGLVAGALIVVDLSFFGANIIKVEHGGWFPLLIAAAVYALMSTWRRGRDLIHERLRKAELPIDAFLDELEKTPILRIPGTAVVLTGDPDATPSALTLNIAHNHVLHEHVVLMTVTAAEVPYLKRKEQVDVEELRDGFWRVRTTLGFMQAPNIPRLIGLAHKRGLEVDLADVTYFLSSETVLAKPMVGMWIGRARLFAFMARNAQQATAYFSLPPDRVVEIGRQIEV